MVPISLLEKVNLLEAQSQQEDQSMVSLAARRITCVLCQVELSEEASMLTEKKHTVSLSRPENSTFDAIEQHPISAQMRRSLL